MSNDTRSDRLRLRAIAFDTMRARGLDPDFSQAELAEAAAIGPPATSPAPARDLRRLPWCSIDNDDSRDLDQLSASEALKGGDVRVLVAIADVDAAVPRGSTLDRHAAVNTTSVYTPGVIFPMLPERLSTDLTSLNEHEDRLAVVTEIVVSSDGALKTSEVYPAVVRNQAKLAYNAVGAWLIGGGPLPPAAANVRGMDEQLRMQDRVAQSLSEARHRTGALDFETIEVEHVFDGDTLRDVQAQRKNRAKALIENLMIAANGVTARFLDARGFPSLRRVVKSPERWERIRNLAEEMGEKLPPEPDSIALSALLARRRQQDPDTFPDFSRSIIQLLGSGEYVVDPPGTEPFLVPLAIPSIAGPSALATVMLMASRDPGRIGTWFIALTVAMAATTVLLALADRLQRWLGERAVLAFERLMGLVLTALAVEMLLTGVRSFVGELGK